MSDRARRAGIERDFATLRADLLKAAGEGFAQGFAMIAASSFAAKGVAERPVADPAATCPYGRACSSYTTRRLALWPLKGGWLGLANLPMPSLGGSGHDPVRDTPRISGSFWWITSAT